MIRPSYFTAVLLTCATALPVLSYCAVEMYFVPDPVPEYVLPDGRQFLAGPPDRQSAAFQDDLRVFHATRALKDSPRWRLARLDADHSDTALARDFSCAAGFWIDLAETPHLVRFLRRSRHAIRRRVTEEKHLWHRTRPFVGNDLPVCVGKNTDLDGHASYPSGHATAGLTMALLLADLLPDQREAIMTRGHVFGESRLVCGFSLWPTFRFVSAFFLLLFLFCCLPAVTGVTPNERDSSRGRERVREIESGISLSQLLLTVFGARLIDATSFDFPSVCMNLNPVGSLIKCL